VPTKKKIRRVSPYEEEDPCVGLTKRVRRSNRLCAEGLKEACVAGTKKKNSACVAVKDPCVGSSEEARRSVGQIRS